MISAKYANDILNYLFGRQVISTISDSTIDSITSDRDRDSVRTKIYNLMSQQSLWAGGKALYLGLTTNEPDKNTGVLTSGEPRIDNDGTDTNYKRVQLKKSSTDTAEGTNIAMGQNQNKNFYSASKGIIKNSEEIKFNVAKTDWGQMNYWFLIPSASSTSDVILWGSIKDVIQDKLNVTVDAMNISNTVTIDIPELVQLTGQTKYTIAWEDSNGEPQEVDVVSSEKFVDGNGNTCVILSSDEPLSVSNPVQITHWITGDTEAGFTTHYQIKSYDKVPGEYNIHGYGINVRTNTVPTFFKEQLVASIDLDKE